MNRVHLRRGLVLVAVVAILTALALMLVPHGHSGDAGAWLAILPILMVGIISPLSLLSPLAYVYLGRTSNAPILPFSFQRPPPLTIA